MKRRTSPFENAVAVVAMLPWWVCLILAVASFALFHYIGAIEPGRTTTPAVATDNLFRTIIGTIGQIAVPAIFVIAAAISALGRSKTMPNYESRSPTLKTPETTPIHDDDLYQAWKDVGRVEPPSIDTSRWSSELLNALEWKRFELLCAAYFETLGFKSRVAREGPDGGVDIHLYPSGSTTPAIVVQCKAWKTYHVGVKPIRELLGVITATHVAEGIFVTTGKYRPEAVLLAAENNIHLIDGEDLLRKIGDTSSQAQQTLLHVATEGDFITPTCPSCGTKMVLRVARKTGDEFWGCIAYPRCRRTFRRT